MRIKNIYYSIFYLLILFIYSSFLLNPIHVLAKDDLNCSLCHNFKELKIINPDGKLKSFYVNKNLFNNLVHKKLTCETCHYTIIQTPHLPEQLKKVDCDSKCHVNDASVDRNHTHEIENAQFRKSSHGDRVENPIGCACHNKHLMTKTKEFSPIEINRICSYKCHEDKLFMYKYKVNPLTVSSYLDSYHGEAIKFDENKYPNCFTCHGHHNIKIKEEKDSPVNIKNRLQAVCARKDCHKTGLEKPVFAQGTYHQTYKKDDQKKEIILTKLENAYKYTILFTMILFAFYYIFRYISKVRRKKIWISIFTILIIILMIFTPFLLQFFIKGKGIKYTFKTAPDRYKSICLECHSLYPHNKNIIMRAFMNLHSLKLACEVCHVRSLAEIKLVEHEEKRLELIKKNKASKEKNLEEEEKPLVIKREERGIVYKWYNGKDNAPSVLRRIEGDDGAQIMLFKITEDDKLQILEAKRDTGLDQGFKVSKKAVQCKDCHNKNALIDFRALGYPEKTVKEKLEKSRAFEMLQKSEKFLIPKLF
ncbi:hypothetical protein HZA55_01960 [Candidatus Poribacteria bacterium]|nr:hypothetical protein [Candidatus Poribacteria bacterium]